MILPTTYMAALLLSLFTMLCWGSWANTQKLAGSKWRFELFYADYSIGVFLCAVVAAFTFGSLNEKEITFMDSFAGIALRKIGWAMAGGIIFNVANVLLVAAIAISGMAVAFPIAIGLALIIGVVWNYFLNPQGNPAMLFGGALLVGLAIVVDAIAYRAAHAAKRVAAADTIAPIVAPDPTVNPRRRQQKRKTAAMSIATKGILLSLISGVLMGAFYPFVQISMSDEGMALAAYTAGFFFSIGILLSSVLIIPILMNFPVTGKPLEVKAYFEGTRWQHLLGLLGGILWFAGTISNLAASSAPKSANVGPAVSYALGQGATMISAFWGLFVWKEFRDAPGQVKVLLWAMIALFLTGLTLISLAPLH
jgi:glucose uptake protein